MKKLFIFLVILLSLGTIWPLFHPGLFPVHDDTQVARVLTMGKALHDGMLPVRWVDYLGYNLGYPIFNFYAPLAYYVGGIFTLFGFSALVSTKVMMALGMALAGVSMYLLANSLFGKKAGLLAAIFYLYAPYHALNLYVRGAIGELWAYGFLPLPFFGLWGIYKTRKFRYVIVTALSLAGVIISHNLTAMMVVPFVLLSIVGLSIASWKKKEFSSLYLFIMSLLLGLLLSSFYAVPALLEMHYTNVTSVLGGGSNPLDHFVCLGQLWQSMWGYGGSTPGCVDGMSFMLGKVHVLFVLAGVLVGIYFLIKKRYQDFFVLLFCYVVLILSIFMMLDSSSLLWKSIPQLAFIQFPWRFLSIASLSVALIVGEVIGASGRVRPFITLLMTLFFSIICIFYYGKYFTPQSFEKDSAKYSDSSQISWNISKISDEYLPKEVKKPTSKNGVPTSLIEPVTGEIHIQTVNERTQNKKVSLISSGGVVRINLAYFPAWQFRVDNQIIKPKIVNGIYEFTLGKGAHSVEASFIQTPLETLADILTIVGLSFIILGIIKARSTKSL
jgi:hypothetical protein